MFLSILLFLSITNAESLQPVSTRQQFVNFASTFGKLSIFGTVLPLIASATTADPINNYKVSIEGIQKPIGELLGSKATLVVNVASQCALTPQYEELVDLYNKYSEKGLQILAFPCNQFGNQEPADAAQVRKDMSARFGVKFPILDKVEVNGAGEDPLYTKLKTYPDISVSKVGKISWNFEVRINFPH